MQVTPLERRLFLHVTLSLIEYNNMIYLVDIMIIICMDTSCKKKNRVMPLEISLSLSDVQFHDN